MWVWQWIGMGEMEEFIKELFLCFQQVAINEPHGAAHASAKSTALNLIDENVPALSSGLQWQ